MENNNFKEEIKKFDPSVEEKRKDAFISLYYVIVFLLFGLPMWYMTTTTYRASLPISEISKFSESQITVTIKVNIINFDNNIEMDDLFVLQDKLLQQLQKNKMDRNDLIVKLKFNGYVRQASRDEIRIYNNARTLHQLDPISSQLLGDGDIYFFLVPESSSLIPIQKEAIIRSKGDKNIVLVSFRSMDQVLQIIEKCVTNLMVRNEDLDIVYRAALFVPDKDSLNAIPASVGTFLMRVRSSSKYEWTFSLIVPSPVEGSSVPEWDYPIMEHLYLEPLIRRLAPFVSISVSSQIIYGVHLERIWPSKARGHRDRVYSQEDLTHVVNGIETYLGSNKALNFVGYVASGPGEQQLHLEGDKSGTDAFTVPRWGGMVFINNTTIPVDGHALMGVFLPQILGLMGLSRPNTDSVIQFEELDSSGIAPWQLHAWLRERAVENIAITQLTLQSVLILLDKVANMVIRDDVATHIRTATRLSQNALDALKSVTDDNSLKIAFLSSKQALDHAETAFFHPSLLELLYFQDDQKIGIYIPLFVPILLPLFVAALKAKPFLLELLKSKTD